MAAAPEIREGERALPADPGLSPDAGVVFIGRIRSPWSRGDCPKNLARAREARPEVHIELKPEYAPGLAGLAVGQPIIVQYWMHEARRDLILQRPRHLDAPRGTFALRSPSRPNPVALAVVRLTALDIAAGRLGIDSIDAFDGTPVIDIKPWFDTIDIPPA